ncbi:uncharacterized protein LOC116344918 [Contarinia nasturtii]|uniref:uncharacterized protein LOC116344918 n=1 Tax=Contarinia nasturtii TaxID=265458 RepID=UPI0012D44A85|nr:uncharacterized protein LOC116344918 [Contarinia nasturtii]
MCGMVLSDSNIGQQSKYNTYKNHHATHCNAGNLVNHHQSSQILQLTSSVSRTPKPEIENTELHRQRIKQKLENNEYKYIVAIDPGMKTYLAGIRRNIEDRTEENFKISSKSYHWGAGQKVRDKMGKRMTARFTQREQLDRESYPSIPSPRGIRWRNYVRHRLTMVKDAVAAYARRRYARLSFDKYIGSQGEKDCLAKVITKNEPSLINIGAVDMAPNSLIGIKKGK